MSLKGVAQETLALIEKGTYNVGAESFNIGDAVQAAVANTALWTPEQLAQLEVPPPRFETTIEVTDETTQVASSRVFETFEAVASLNFASAKNPGGGFINGAKAQEEDLARCSALYPCLVSDLRYYEANRRDGTMIYTDHMIYSPLVPFFKTSGRGELVAPYFPSVITAPAPNCGEHLKRHADDWSSVQDALERRARYVLALAANHQNDALVLGAWGCGVFRNSPQMVARTFADLLEGDFSGVFNHICFAVMDRSKSQANLTAFQQTF